jgi:prepilin-type N-terminal cleavage/methylation domain-containing protein/prepilin-type processing-associated H-X9-DG protein
MNSSLPRRKAFTLIELLVVIAIIAILAAILFPVFAQAKAAAKKTVDLSNIKNLGLSHFLYQGDYDDVYDTIRNSPDNWGCGGHVTGNCNQVPGMASELEPYIKNHAIWASPEDSLTHCDSSSSSEPGGCTAAVTGGPISYIPTYNAQTNVIVPVSGFDASESYGVFGMPTSDNPNYFGTPATGSLNSSQVGEPADTIIMCPMFISWSYFSGLVQQRNDQRQFSFKEIIPDYPAVASCPYCWCCPNDALTMEDFNGSCNWLFADGHAKSLVRAATMDRSWYINPSQAILNHAKNKLEFDASYH